jgi:hypothetical protein
MARRTLTIDSNGLHFTVDDGPTEVAPPSYPYPDAPVAFSGATFAEPAPANGSGEVPPAEPAPAPTRRRRNGKRGPMSQAQKDKIRATILRNQRKARRKGGGGKRRGR